MFHGGEDGRATAATQSSVLDAAVAEWSRNAEVEVAAVARRAGVSAGLPYRYFGTRAGLLAALVEDFYGRLGIAAMMRAYDEPTWLQRERRRITDSRPPSSSVCAQ